MNQEQKKKMSFLYKYLALAFVSTIACGLTVIYCIGVIRVHESTSGPIASTLVMFSSDMPYVIGLGIFFMAGGFAIYMLPPSKIVLRSFGELDVELRVRIISPVTRFIVYGVWCIVVLYMAMSALPFMFARSNCAGSPDVKMCLVYSASFILALVPVHCIVWMVFIPLDFIRCLPMPPKPKNDFGKACIADAV